MGWRPAAAGLSAAFFGAGRGQDADDLVQRQRPRSGAGTDESGDARGVADRSPGAVGQVHPDQDVSGVDAPLDLLRLPVLDLGDLFLRHLDLEDEILHVQRLDPVLQVRLDLLLVPGVRVHDVPTARRVLQRGAHLGGRILVDLLGRLDARRLVGHHLVGRSGVGGRVVGGSTSSTGSMTSDAVAADSDEPVTSSSGSTSLTTANGSLLDTGLSLSVVLLNMCGALVPTRRPCPRSGGTGRPCRTPAPP